MLTVADEYRSQAVTLSGTGVAPAGVSLSPTTVTFAATGVGQTAPAQTLTLTNNGGVTLLIQSVVAAGDFAIVTGSNTCGASLGIGAACAAQIVFAPTAAGTRTAAPGRSPAEGTARAVAVGPPGSVQGRTAAAPTAPAGRTRDRQLLAHAGARFRRRTARRGPSAPFGPRGHAGECGWSDATFRRRGLSARPRIPDG